MSTYLHTAITTGAAANAAVINAPLGQLDAVMYAAGGGATVSPAVLKQWTEGLCYEMTAITRDGDGTVSAATVKWPDGSAGTFTRTSKNATWLAVDAYTITHTVSGSTVVQSAVTRNAAGDVTVKPALTVH